jgi:hypothetical protein
MSTSFPPPDPFQPGGPSNSPFGTPPQFPPPQFPPPEFPPQSPFSGPGGQPGGYSGGGPYAPYPRSTSRLSLLALASMLLGAGGLLACCCYPIALPASLLSVVMGHAALTLSIGPAAT